MAPEGIREPRRDLTAEGFRRAQEALQSSAAGRTARPAQAGGGGGGADILAFPTGSAAAPIRAEKVALVKRRITEGYYERPEVKEKLALSLLRNFGDQAQ